MDSAALETISSRKTYKNILLISFMKLFALGAGILTGFVVPKILDVSDYGFVKIADLYASYIGVVTLGFFDGIILKYSGKDFADLDKPKFNLYNRFHIYWNLIIAVFVALSCLFFVDPNYRIVFLWLSLDLILTNVMMQFQAITQMTSRFSLETIIGLGSSLVKLLLVGLLSVFYFTGIWTNVPFWAYLIISLGPTVFALVWYLIVYRDFVFGPAQKIHEAKSDILFFIRTGFPLMIGNFAIIFFLDCDRQFVNIYYPVETYAVYSFAYSLLTLVSTAVSGISIVIFPVLKQKQIGVVFQNYNKLVSLLLIVTCLCAFAYFPAYFIVVYWLPKYMESLSVFRVIIAAFCAQTCVTVINQNYYKLEMKNISFLVMTLAVLAISIGLNFVAFYWIGTTYSISFGTLISVLLWYLVTTYPLLKKSAGNKYKNTIFLILFLCSFVGCSYLSNIWLDFGVSFLFYLILVICFFHKEIGEKVNDFRRKRNKRSNDSQSAEGESVK